MVSSPRVLPLLSLMLCLGLPMAATGQEPLRTVPESRSEIQLSFSPVVKKVAPAVVNIYTSRTVAVQNPFMNDPLFRHFFRGLGVQPNLGERTVNSLGSGVIISADGLVVTSNHVIQGAQEVRVVLSDRREFDGEILLHDPQSDLALLRLKGGQQNFPYVRMRDSDTLEVGDLVLALGNPFGVGQTVTSGIISALARTTVGVADYQFFIQTDAAINPGNSGGALVDMDGKLIGVNTAIYSTSGASNGIGFAIPSNMVQTVVASAQSGSDYVVRPWLGLTVQQITGEMAESLGMQRPQGVIITDMVLTGPASQGGLAVGDVIMAVNDKPIFDAQGLQFRSAIARIGEYATFRVLRNGKALERQVLMVAPPEVPKRDLRRLEGVHPFRGVTVGNLSPALATELGMETTETGVVVVEKTGNRLFQRKDIILSVNGTEAVNSQHLAQLLQRQANSWAISLKRGGKTMSLNVRR